MSIEHLYNSYVKVQRLQLTVAAGKEAQQTWVDQPAPLARVKCRLNLGFLRPGIDAPQPYEAGKAKDRTGIMFCSPNVPLRSGDRIVPISGPVTGIFDIKEVPDKAIAFSDAHHIEVQIVETVATLTGDRTPPTVTTPPTPVPEFDD